MAHDGLFNHFLYHSKKCITFGDDFHQHQLKVTLTHKHSTYCLCNNYLEQKDALLTYSLVTLHMLTVLSL